MKLDKHLTKEVLMSSAMGDHASTTIKVVYAKCACSGRVKGTAKGEAACLFSFSNTWRRDHEILRRGL